MEVFRIARKAHATKFSSSNSANRWNVKGQHVIYACSSRSLCTLELIIHKVAVVPTERYKVMVISIADDDDLTRQIQTRELPVNWRKLAAYPSLQKIGSDWFNKQETLILKVPSAVIPHEYNYVINTEHPQFSKKVRLVRTEDYFWDRRMMAIVKKPGVSI